MNVAIKKTPCIFRYILKIDKFQTSVAYKGVSYEKKACTSLSLSGTEPENKILEKSWAETMRPQCVY